MNATGSSVMSMPPAVWRATVNVEVARSPGSGKSARKCAPRLFSRFSAASAITRLISMSERRLSQSCQVRLKARLAIGDAGRQQLRLDRVERGEAAIEPGAVAHARPHRPTWHRAASRADR